MEVADHVQEGDKDIDGPVDSLGQAVSLDLGVEREELRQEKLFQS